MAGIEGKFKLEKSENFDTFLDKLGMFVLIEHLSILFQKFSSLIRN